nr:phenolpthiocerol synthesis type-I polyketide synthase PpsA [Mycolicibacter nonchromogenicus]
MVGFIKTVLAVQRGQIPKNLHFNTPNPHITFEQMRLKVVAETRNGRRRITRGEPGSPPSVSVAPTLTW